MPLADVHAEHPRKRAVASRMRHAAPKDLHPPVGGNHRPGVAHDPFEILLALAEGESRRLFSLSPLGRSVAAAEAARPSDQVFAARSLRLFKGSGAIRLDPEIRLRTESTTF